MSGKLYGGEAELLAQAEKNSIKFYEGFGEYHTIGAWAQLFMVQRSTLWRNVKARVSIEEFARKKGIKYPDERRESLPKVNEKAKRAGMVHLLMRELLIASGYNFDPGDIHLTRSRSSGFIVHILGVNQIGFYDYVKDVLTLSGGEKLKTADPIVDDVRIRADPKTMLWYIHPDTKGKLIECALAKVREENPGPIDYSSVMKKKKEPVPRQLYEYNGKQATCAEWSRWLHIPRSTLWRWLRRGYTIEEVLTKRKEKQI